MTFRPGLCSLSLRISGPLGPSWFHVVHACLSPDVLGRQSRHTLGGAMTLNEVQTIFSIMHDRDSLVFGEP